MEYYVQHPFDDLHRYHRPAALIAKAGFPKAEIPELIDFLHPRPASATDLADSDKSTLAAFGFKPPVR